MAISNVWASETITMKTAGDSIFLSVSTTDNSSVMCNGTTVAAGDYAMVKISGGTVALTTIGSAKFTSLMCDNSWLTELNISGCTALTNLSCGSNELTELNVSGHTVLERVSCYKNKLATLNANGCTSLEMLSCHGNSLTTLNISGCSKLTYLSADDQAISVPGTSSFINPVLYTNKTAVEPIQVGANSYAKGAAINIPENGLLSFTTNVLAGGNGTFGGIFVAGDKFKDGTVATMTTTKDMISLDVRWLGAGSITLNGAPLNNGVNDNIVPGSGNIVLAASGGVALTNLSCDDSKLTALDVSGCATLEWLSCNQNSLTELDLSGCTALKSMFCGRNNLKALNLSGLKTLESVYCYESNLTALNVSGCTALKSLSCGNNQLTTLNLSGYTALDYLSCEYNKLSALNVSGCTALSSIECSNNELTSLNINGCTALQYLTAGGQAIKIADVSSGTFANPVLYTNRTGNAELIEIGGTPYAKNAAIPVPTDADYLDFKTPTTIGYSWNTPLGGTFFLTDKAGPKTIATLTSSESMVTFSFMGTMTGATAALTANGIPVRVSNWGDPSEKHTVNTLNGEVVLETLGDVRIPIFNFDSPLTGLDVSGNTDLTILNCPDIGLSKLDISGCTALTTLYAVQTSVTLPKALIDATAGTLSVPMPIIYNGTAITQAQITSIANSGIYNAGKLEWTVSGENGTVGFEFSVALPSGVTGSAFSAAVTQPWSKNSNSALAGTESGDIVVRTLDGAIVIDGTSAGEHIAVYNIAGMLTANLRASADETYLPLSKGCYVVKIGKKAVKVML